MSSALFLSDNDMSQKWKRIYDEQKFPFEVRFHLDEWINQIAWGEIRQDKNVLQHSQALIGKLYEQIKCKVSDPQLSPLDKLNLQSAHQKIQEEFHNQPVDLIDVIQNCLNQERLLLDSSKIDSDDRRPTEEDLELLQYRGREDKIKNLAQYLRQNSQKVEKNLEDFHTTLDQSIPRISDLQDTIRENEEKFVTVTDVRQQQQIQKAISDANSQISKIWHVIATQKNALKEVLLEGCKVTVQIIGESWEAINLYRQQQKNIACFTSKPPEGAVDSLNKIGTIGGHGLMSYMGYLDMALADVGRLEVPRDPIKNILLQLQTELSKFLEKHLNNIFVITRQPQNVIKIVQNKSPQLNMCIRLLGGSSLGIGHTFPVVTVRVYSETNLKEAMDAVGPVSAGVCKTVENGTNVPMTLKRPNDHMQANLNNMVLRGVERFEKKDKDERVTDYKYGVVCYTKVIVRNKEYPLKVLSLPIVFTSQTSQEGPAKGTLMWDAFSPLDRNIFDDPPEVKWEQFEPALKGLFKETGLPLNDSQLEYIRCYVLGNGVPLNPNENRNILTKERFLRDKVRGCDFTYWMWLYACKNIIMECVHSEWKDSMLYGFIGRQEAENVLKHKDPGTFLLRFRERKIEGSQKANKCAYLALAVVGLDPQTGEKIVDHIKDHLTPTEIHKYGLVRILKSMVDTQTHQPLLNTLYPDEDFYQKAQKYIPDEGISSEGYTRTEFMIRVMKPDGSEPPLSPLSTISNNSAACTPAPSHQPDWPDLPQLDPKYDSFPTQFQCPESQMSSQMATINFSDFLDTHQPLPDSQTEELLLGPANIPEMVDQHSILQL